MLIDEVLQELRRLNEPVPKPRQRPSAAEVDLVQQRPGVTFHPDYRKYLLVASDVVLGRVTARSGGAGNVPARLPEVSSIVASESVARWLCVTQTISVPRHLDRLERARQDGRT